VARRLTKLRIADGVAPARWRIGAYAAVGLVILVVLIAVGASGYAGLAGVLGGWAAVVVSDRVWAKRGRDWHHDTTDSESGDTS